MAPVWAELKRRNVVRVAVAYAIVGWLLIEVSSTVFPLVQLPDWTVTFVTMLVLLGYPLALILAWAYELTPEGIKSTKSVEPVESITHATGRKLDFIIIGVMGLAIMFLLIDNYLLVVEEVPAIVSTPTETPIEDGPAPSFIPDRKSVAVLPFANRSNDANDAFFVDGIHDDILTHIAKISSLKVISRTSVMGYRDTTKNVKTIGEELGVATLLEGGVQRAGDSVRINVQLIDANTDEHLWAETYDRVLTTQNIFAIQTEIGIAISEELLEAYRNPRYFPQASR